MNALPLSYYSDEPVHSPLKVGLFTRIHEMRGTLDELTPIAQQALPVKRLWLRDNKNLLQGLLEDVTSEDPLQFESTEMDPDMVKLLTEYTGVLQELVVVIHSIFQADAQPRRATKRASGKRASAKSRGGKQKA